ncbi:hypothetical protein SAMN04489761_2928 [Tenacibaculum sp. MAR_2009_124]|nr:hypothetical protein SAMN04489761_2928 [Tenacibaculum sp. MAR_2009_124]
MLLIIVFYSCNLKSKSNVFGNSLVKNIPFTENASKQGSLLELDSLNVKFQLRGDCYAYSSPKNSDMPNGEGRSDNLPKIVTSEFPRNGLYLTINERELVKYTDSTLGHKLYLVNTTDSILNLEATDSRLDVFIEAIDLDKKWKAISYLPNSSCGNSYHVVNLDREEFWCFDVPVFKGTFKTKLRYVLDVNGWGRVVSNEISCHLNKDQFDDKRKQGYFNDNLMEPYKD